MAFAHGRYRNVDSSDALYIVENWIFSDVLKGKENYAFENVRKCLQIDSLRIQKAKFSNKR
jgi:hypothetical protein